MRRLVVTLCFLGLALPVASQSFLPTPPGQIETIIELLDAVEVAEQAVLGDGALGEAEIRELEELSRVADTIGAEDLAARARSLLVLARPTRVPVADQPTLGTNLSPARDARLIRGSDRFQTMANILGATGGTAFVLSAGFYALAERDYRRWLDAGSADEGDELFRAWRGYELLSLGLGGAGVVALGVGFPLLYSLASPAAALATPPARAVYSPREAAARLNQLYGERAQIVTALDRYPDRGPDRELARTIGTATGVIGSIASVALFYVAEERYQEYLLAPFSDDAERLGRQVRLFDGFAISSAILAGAGFGTSVGIAVFTEDRDELEAALRDVNRRIVTLRTAAQIEVPPRGSVQRMLEPEPVDGPEDATVDPEDTP